MEHAIEGENLRAGPFELPLRCGEPNYSSIVCGDVIETLEGLPEDRTFDLVIADPPYNIGKDFGNNSDCMPEEEYVKWSWRWLELCLSLLAENGIMYVYGFPEIVARIAARHPLEDQRWLVWHYTNKTVPRLSFWQRSHESILCLWKPGNKRPDLEVDQIREPYTDTFLNNAAGNLRKGTDSRYGGTKGRETVYVVHEKGALPRDVIKVPALAGGAGAAERWFMCRDCGEEVFPPSAIGKHRSHAIWKHPTQKPMELTKRLLRSRICGSRGSVLVPFAGSGSECVVARKFEIPFLGIEINPMYVDFANKWMEKANLSINS